ncbi:hypothetical protein PIB30_098676 [Stylosanthes scabra]|uniref:Uncharacterized protein n=1 Tax=Stylosanthes scabra TaxID=79078 RepID=A0ABU6ZVA8_9FABA|nr:hypothetical protein [Stylosanthes scabra]
MSEPPLLSIHYDGEITADHNGSVVFCSNQLLFIRMPRDVRSLVALKNFVAQAIGCKTQNLDPDQDDGGDEVEEELNSFRISQVSLAQPAISQPYEYPDHFSTLNLDAMNSDVCLGQGALMMIRRLSLRLVNNLRTRRKFSWQLRHIASGELCNSRY